MEQRGKSQSIKLYKCARVYVLDGFNAQFPCIPYRRIFSEMNELKYETAGANNLQSARIPHM